MKKVKITNKSALTLKNIKGFLERVVKPFGTSGRIDFPKEFIGKSIRDLDVRAKHGLDIIAVRKKDKPADGGSELNVAPKADYIIKQGDIFVIIGANVNLDKFKKKYHIEK